MPQHLPPLLLPALEKNNNNIPNQATPYQRLRRFIMWTFPIFIAVASCLGFGVLAHYFHQFVQWWSYQSWYPPTENQIQLQANVVTQVVNGPVITSVSILFATLSSMTISSLYERQIVIRKCYALELRSLRLLHMGIQAIPSELEVARRMGEDLLVQYTQQLFQESRGGGGSGPTRNNDLYYEKETVVEEQGFLRDSSGDGHLMALLNWSNDLLLPQRPPDSSSNSSSNNKSTKKTHPSPPPPAAIVGQIQSVLSTLLSQRHLRSLALSTVFPIVHWLTLTFLAAAIGISFLVATDQQDFIFLHGFPIRILWGVLMGSFTSLAILCYDLYSIYDGAYMAFTTSA
jgi:hypothetical protein